MHMIMSNILNSSLGRKHAICASKGHILPDRQWQKLFWPVLVLWPSALCTSRHNPTQFPFLYRLFETQSTPLHFTSHHSQTKSKFSFEDSLSSNLFPFCRQSSRLQYALLSAAIYYCRMILVTAICLDVCSGFYLSPRSKICMEFSEVSVGVRTPNMKRVYWKNTVI